MKTIRALLVVSLSVLGLAFGLQSSGCAWGAGALNVGCPEDAGPDWGPACQDAGGEGGSGGTGGTGGTGGAGGAGGQGGMAFCPGSCVPLAPSGWSRPEPYWVGDGQLVPADCAAVGGEPVLRYAEPFAEVMDCGTCACDPAQGKCSLIPEEITVFSEANCNANGEATNFSGPAGWDGSCTAENALPANADCNGVPCAHSIYIGPLSPPVEGACQASVTGAQAPPPVQWDTAALRCSQPPLSDDINAACGSTKICAPVLPAPYRYCVARSGDVLCPAGTVYSGAHSTRVVVVGPEDVIDTRGCSACDCVTKKKGDCKAQFLFDEGSACDSNPILTTVLSSSDVCISFGNAGRALGSKSVTDLFYVPGQCETTGAEPIGNVTINKAETTTICCRDELI